MFLFIDLTQIIIFAGIAGALLIAAGGIAYLFDCHIRFYLWLLRFPPMQFSVRVLRNREVEMEDGIKLFADLYVPKGGGRHPTIVIRTVYSKSNTDHKYPFIATLFATQGFNVVVQDARGKYASEGEFEPFINEEKDGLDTIKWIRDRPWYDGRIIFFGFSYLGTCSWLVAANNPPDLVACVPIFCSQNAYASWVDSGVPYLKDILYWLAKHQGRHARAVNHEEVDEMIYHLPVLQFDKRLREGVDTFKLWMTHLQQQSGYWTSISVHHRRDSIRAPLLFIAGWYDRFINNTIEEFIETVLVDPKNDGVKKSCLLIGPWAHHPTDNYLDMPFPASVDFRLQFSSIIRWIQYALEGKQSIDWKEFPVRYYLLGKNKWCQSDTWPPPGCKEKQFFLTVSQGKGYLSDTLGKESKSLQFVYDPDNPFPSIGGNMIYGNTKEGPRDVTPYMNRHDVITWSSDPISSPFALAGPSRLLLYVASSAKDTDFYAKLCVTKKKKRTYHLTHGFVRMRYLDSVKATNGIQPGQSYRLELSLGNLAYSFNKGDQITLLVTSSDFPNHGRNLNTGGSNEGDSEEIKAYQTVFQGGIYRSALTLTTIEEKDLVYYENK